VVCKDNPRAFARDKRSIEGCLDFWFIRAFVASPQGGRGGECIMLPSMGDEQDISVELLSGNSSEVRAPFDKSQLVVQRHAPKDTYG
jgi:hypothetical protein